MVCHHSDHQGHGTLVRPVDVEFDDQGSITVHGVAGTMATEWLAKRALSARPGRMRRELCHGMLGT